MDHWTLKAEFGTIAQLTNFFTRGFGNGMVLKSRNKTQSACNFMGVDGFVIGSSMAAMYKEFQGRLDALGMTHFEIFCEGNQGNLQFDYGDIVLHFAFVLDKGSLITEGEMEQEFYELLVPLENSPIQVLMDGVEIRGE